MPEHIQKSTNTAFVGIPESLRERFRCSHCPAEHHVSAKTTDVHCARCGTTHRWDRPTLKWVADASERPDYHPVTVVW